VRVVTFAMAVALAAAPSMSARAQVWPPGWRRVDGLAPPRSLAPIAIEPHRARRIVALAGVLDGPVAVGNDGSATFLTDEGILGRVNPDGNLRWSLLVAPPGGAPAVGPQGTIYAAGRDGWLYAVGAAGAALWSARLGGQPVRGVAVGAERLAVALDDGRVAFWRADGRPIGWVALGSAPSGAPALAGALAIVPTSDGLVVAVDGGRVAWRARVAAAAVGPLAIGADGQVYAGAEDGTVASVRADGRVLWRVAVHDAVTRSPALAEDGTVIVAAGAAVVAVSASGQLRWRAALGAPIVAGPLVAAGDTIYVGVPRSGAGELCALDARGAVLRRIALPAAPTRGLALFDRSLWTALEDRTLRRIEVPERGLAQSGWAKARGDVDNRGVR
jgi:outer membrane protein assembly factor BamB